MKVLYLTIYLSLCNVLLFSQTLIQMEKKNGVYYMPCKVNGLELQFIFDTGASDVSISLAEAIFMIKNGYLDEDDLKGTTYFKIANGEIAEGTLVNLKSIDIGPLTLKDISASIVHNLDAPLLMGQSALSQLGNIQFDYSTNSLIVLNGPKNVESNEPNNTTKTANLPGSSEQSIDDRRSRHNRNFSSARHKKECPYETRLNTTIDVHLRQNPTLDSPFILMVPKNSIIKVIEKSTKSYYKVIVNGTEGYISLAFLEHW